MTQRLPSSADWQAVVTRIKEELAALGEADRHWLRHKLAAIHALQLAMDSLFMKVNGRSVCATCLGDCCGCGRHHLTLTNLLGFLLEKAEPPQPDFSQTCPFLGDEGCRLPVTHRPYNCVTFFCEALEDQLGDVGRAQLRELDGRLRYEYEQVAQRFPLASLRGIWIALERVEDGFLLRRRPEPC